MAGTRNRVRAERPSSSRRLPRDLPAAEWKVAPLVLRSIPTTMRGSPRYGSKTIAVFDKNGKPLTPPEGINFGGRLGLMQGVIVTPKGDVWVLGIEKRQLVYFPKGD